MKTRRLVPLDRTQAARAYAFCADRPHQCAFIAGWITEGGLDDDPRVPRGWLLAELDANETIVGLVFLSDTGIVLPALATDEGADEIVRLGLRSPSSVRVLVGERQLIDRILRSLVQGGATVRLSRTQQGYLVDRATFRATSDLELRAAGLDLLDQVVSASAAMAREEAKDDPERRNPSLFRQRIRDRLSRGRDLVHVDGERLVFKSNVASLSPDVGQIEGIYTLPDHRNRGYGTRGTTAVTRWVLDRARQAFLLVNHDNQSAIRLYERLGYRAVVESRTVFLAP